MEINASEFVAVPDNGKGCEGCAFVNWTCDWYASTLEKLGLKSCREGYTYIKKPSTEAGKQVTHQDLYERIAQLEEDLEKKADMYRDVLKHVYGTLLYENARPNGPIADTIWFSNTETLFNYIDTVLIEGVK